MRPRLSPEQRLERLRDRARVLTYQLAAASRRLRHLEDDARASMAWGCRLDDLRPLADFGHADSLDKVVRRLHQSIP